MEYGMVFGIVAAALIGMRIYFQRGVQSVIKVVADDYSNQSQGAPINNIELAAKMQIYQVEGKDFGSQTSKGDWKQRVQNKQHSNIRTELNGTMLVTSNGTSVSGDFRHKD